MTEQNQFWEQYYLHARNWAADMPKALTTEAIESVTGIKVPQQLKDAAVGALVANGLPIAFFLTGEISNYVANPDDKCVFSSWVYRTLKEAPTLDYGYVEDALQGVEGAEQVLPELKSSITDITKDVEPCFSLGKYAKGTVKEYLNKE